MENKKIELIKKTKEKLENNEYQNYFYLPILDEVPSMEIIEIYNQMNFLKKNGKNVTILAGGANEKKNYNHPDYIDDEKKDIPIIFADKKNVKINTPDWLFVPEFLTNIMKQVKDLPCNKVVLYHSYHQSLRALLPGMNYLYFGFKNIITTSSNLSEFIRKTEPNVNYNIKEYTIGIPDYFKPNFFKEPIISFFSRNHDDIKKVSSIFYAKNPHYRWIKFQNLRGDEPKGLSRQEFAEKMAKSFCVLYIDKIASFGTVPLEGMKCNTPVVLVQPELIPEYLGEKNTIMGTNILALDELVKKVVDAQLQNTITDDFYQENKNISDKYTLERSESTFMESYNDFIQEAVNSLQITLEKVSETKKIEKNA